MTASPNVNLVRSIFAAWERGNYSSTEWAHPEIEFVLSGEGPASGRWTGVAGMAEGVRDWLSAWQDFRIEAEEYRLDGERVVVLTRHSGRGKASGLEVGQMWSKGAAVFHVRDKVTRLVMYSDRERALADLGLAPEARSSPS